MKLDRRIIEGKKPLTCFDTEEAKQFIGQEGYFSNKKVYFQDLNDACRDVLQDVFDSYDNTPPFKHSNDFCQNLNETYCFVSSVTGYKYFLPSEWVKEPEKKYRPFTNEEFLALFDSGKLHSIRKKNETGRYIITDIYFNDEYEKGTIFVRLNHCDAGLAMRYLANNGYEYFDGKDWQPFGMLVDGDEK